MSATNRGAVRNEADFYVTPRKTVDLILNEISDSHYEYAQILEPCAGNGAIVKALREWFSSSTITANEIRREERNSLFESGADYVVNCDFIKPNTLGSNYDLIITNPPYSIAQEIIEHCFKIAPDAEVIMLLRLGFLESQKRREFWERHPLTQLYPLLKRPSFTGKGTDATAYGWFVWSKYRKPLIKPI